MQACAHSIAKSVLCTYIYVRICILYLCKLNFLGLYFLSKMMQNKYFVNISTCGMKMYSGHHLLENVL